MLCGSSAERGFAPSDRCRKEISAMHLSESWVQNDSQKFDNQLLSYKKVHFLMTQNGGPL